MYKKENEHFLSSLFLDPEFISMSQYKDMVDELNKLLNS